MNLNIYKKINAYIGLSLSIMMALSIVTASAAETTFTIKGVITHVDTPLKRWTTQNPTGYESGDDFTVEYTFDNSFPTNGNNGYFAYPGVISSMSFSSDTNNAAAVNGDISLDLEDVPDYYFASFPQASGGNVGNYNPVSLNLSWAMISGSFPPPSYSNLFNGPPISPHFDSSLPLDSQFGTFPPPNYGGIDIKYDGMGTVASIRGVIKSFSVRHHLVEYPHSLNTTPCC